MDKSEIYLIAFIAAWVIIMGGVAVYLGRNKGRSFLMCFLLGIFGGVIGWVIAYFLKPPLTEEEKISLRQKYESQEGNFKDN